MPNGPGARSGIQEGDVIVSLDAQEVPTRKELYLSLWRHAPGEKMTLEVMRDNEVRAADVDRRRPRRLLQADPEQRQGVPMDLGIKGKTALVVAASKGMGKASALGLAAEGARVAMCARGEAALNDAAAEVKRQTGAEVLALTADANEPGTSEWWRAPTGPSAAWTCSWPTWAGRLPGPSSR